MPEQFALYSAATEDYPLQRSDGACFGATDGIFVRPVMEAKRFKILHHLFFPEHEATIWLDANIRLKDEAESAVTDFLGDSDFAVFAHPKHKTVWQEFAALRRQERFRIPWLQAQLEAQEAAYRREGLPDATPMYECNFMIRRNKPSTNRLMEAWWAQICRWQWRDQVSLPYVLWKHGGVRLRVIHEGDIREHDGFDYVSRY